MDYIYTAPELLLLKAALGLYSLSYELVFQVSVPICCHEALNIAVKAQSMNKHLSVLEGAEVYPL